MADSGFGTLIKVGLLGGAAYLVYELFFATPAAPAAAAPPSAPGSSASAPPPAYNFNSLSNLFSRIQQYASADKAPAQLTGFGWTVYYNQAGGPAIDPSVVFGSVAAASAEMTIAQYWAAVSGWLAANKGLTGLGVYAALGSLAYGRAY